MKKIMLFALLVAVFSGCEMDKENEINEQKFYELTKIAENSNENISELPLGFNFEMTIDAVKKKVNKMLKDSILFKTGDNYYKYVYELSNGKKFDVDIQFGYYEDKLYALRFSFSSNPFSEPPFVVNDQLIIDIDNDLTNKLDASYNRISFYDTFQSDDGKKEKHIFTRWFKENQYIFLRYAFGADINYINAPADKAISDESSRKIMERYEKKEGGVKVYNSVYDGSVRQVEKYLKNTLKDPKSYESIEWGEVREYDNGYKVYHKYRAKNSFGGYGIESHIFHIDFKGNIINVE